MFFVLVLFTGIYLVSIKLSDYYLKELDKRKKFIKLRKNYYHGDKSKFKNIA